MEANKIGIADGWQDISSDSDEYHSTVAFFSGGAKCVVDMGCSERGDEVLIWQGVPKLVEEDDEAYELTVFEGYEEEEVPEGSDYLVTVVKNGNEVPVNSEFAQDIESAKDIAREEVENVFDGEY
jgi:hypothetical protein